MQSKNIVIAILVIVLIGAVGFLYFNSSNEATVVVRETPTDNTMTTEENEIEEVTEPTEEVMMEERDTETVIGTSVEGKDITAYHFGEGTTEILFVGGVHGGYSPNTYALANELITYFQDNEDTIPKNLLVTIIPNLNPDGSMKSGATGRFNANEVDLNRNFDCDWSETATWQNKTVSGGDAPFSEPEAEALKKYVETYEPTAAIVWFSAEGKVYPSACAGTPSKASVELAATFATAAGYPAEAEFNAYAITGDMVNWMAKMRIPAISVLLTDYKNTEFTKNKAGVEAVLKTYATQ